jgi:hypothetical protein
LRVAVLNIEQTRAQYDVRRADLLPTLNVGGTATRQATGAGTLGNVYTVGAAVSGYELDLFGRVRSLSEAALRPVPGDCRDAKGGADQPGRLGGDELPGACSATTSRSR